MFWPFGVSITPKSCPYFMVWTFFLLWTNYQCKNAAAFIGQFICLNCNINQLGLIITKTWYNHAAPVFLFGKNKFNI